MRFIFTLFLLASFPVFSQQTKTIHGTISSTKTGEKLIGVSIFDTLHKVAASTNEYGFYSITIPTEETVLKISSDGFETKIITIGKNETETDIILNEQKTLQEVTISAKKRSIESTNIGTMDLPLDKVDKLPVLLGEKDVLKILQLMPGVKSGGEGSSGIYVRGGGPDQNLILLDGVPIYNASHLFGFFSVFNSDALSQVTLIKGGFPARYGGRVSSVLDMRMKEGNNQKYNVEGSVGVIASRILVEGPIIKNKCAFIVSARRTYLDVITKPFLPAATKGGYYFYDLNTKVNYKINNRHHLYFSGYFGQDNAAIKTTNSDQSGNITNTTVANSSINWGNAIGALRWNYKIGPKLFKNTTFTYSKYQFNIGTGATNTFDNNGTTTNTDFSFKYLSGINDWSGKSDFTFLPNPNHNIKFGFGDIYHTFKPGINTFSTTTVNQSSTSTQGSAFQYAHELSTYIEDDQKISSRLKVNYGLYYSLFLVSNTKYSELQPRLSANYILDENSSLKFGYARTAQFLHLLSNTGIGLPTDLWVPATSQIAPVTANQISLGYNREIKKQYNFVVEAYYKKMNHVIQYKEGASFFSQNTDWQSKVEVGQGWAYGSEFFLEKRAGRFSGWIGYTLSWSLRQFDNINFGKIFPYRYDRRHDISVVMTYKLNDTWDFGLVFVYGTGNAVTLPTQNYNLAPNPITADLTYSQVGYTSSINNYRMPAYNRMDISANRTRIKKWGETVLSFSVYNIYNRKNPYFLYTENKGDHVALMQVSLFPIIPSISWKFKFNFEKMKENKLNSKPNEK